MADLIPGSHSCFLYTSEVEHQEAMTAFMLHGFEQNQKVIYIGGTHSPAWIQTYFQQAGASAFHWLDKKQLVILPVTQHPVSALDPHQMVRTLMEAMSSARDEDYSGLRVTVEMPVELVDSLGQEALLNYESRLNSLLGEQPCILLCQYDRRKIPAGLLVEIIAAHPVIAASGQVYENVLYVPTKTFLAPDPNARLEHLLQMLSKQQQLYQDLLASEQRFRTLVSSMDDVIYTLDTRQRYTGIFGRFQKNYPISTSEYMGKTAQDLYGPVDGEIHRLANQRALQGERVVYDWSLATSEGRLYFQSSVSPLFDEQGLIRGLVGVARDLTELREAETKTKQTEAALEEYTRRLEQSNQELESFAFVASHDLQEPLRKIQAFSQKIRDSLNDQLGPQEQDYMDRMLRAVERMRNMVDGLLSLSRITTRAQPFERVDMSQVAAEVLTDLEVRLEKTGGKVILHPLPIIQADPLQMRQLLQNLISNSLKFHRPGVPPLVEIGTDCERRSDKDCSEGRRAGKEAGFVSIWIRDNGIGIPEGELPGLFQPFHRLHGVSEYEGTGMGLAICRKIVERHNGRIQVNSVPGQGSTFIICLPHDRVPDEV